MMYPNFEVRILVANPEQLSNVVQLLKLSGYSNLKVTNEKGRPLLTCDTLEKEDARIAPLLQQYGAEVQGRTQKGPQTRAPH
ncbi:hypothetical protein KKC44_00860 [Patescibacteria group bacterium]|nr:hypothetical protein [Patescibacteria group bacterium]